jgi:hypothetical protein
MFPWRRGTLRIRVADLVLSLSLRLRLHPRQLECLALSHHRDLNVSTSAAPLLPLWMHDLESMFTRFSINQTKLIYFDVPFANISLASCP